MRKVIYDIDINLQEYDIKACMQNDDINLIINIYENEKNYDLMGAKATLNWSKPDGTPLKKDMDINKNIVSITLNKDYTDIKGKAKLDIEIVKEGTVSTFPLCLVIVEKVFQSNKVNNKIVELLDIIKMDEYIDEFLDGIKKKQTELSSQIDENTNLLNARMDTFTKLEEGSTTGDAELKDIRVGANGETYESAGTAVRIQFENSERNIQTVKEIIDIGITNIKTMYNWELGYINNSGKYISSDYMYRTTKAIKLGYSKINIKFDNQHYVFHVIKYNGDVASGTDYIAESEFSLEIDSNCKYAFCLQYRIDNTTVADLSTLEITCVSEINKAIENIDKKIDEKEHVEIADITMKRIDLNIKAYTPAEYNDYRNFKNNNYKYTCTIKAGKYNYAYFLFALGVPYSELKNKKIKIEIENMESVDLSFENTYTHKFIISNKTNFTGIQYNIANSLENKIFKQNLTRQILLDFDSEDIKSLYSDITDNLNILIGLGASSDIDIRFNVCMYLFDKNDNRNGIVLADELKNFSVNSYLEFKRYVESILNNTNINKDIKIICYGDSLTEGAGGEDSSPDGTKTSYPSVIEKLSGITTINAGIGGDRCPDIFARIGSEPIILNNITIPATTTPVDLGYPLTTILGNTFKSDILYSALKEGKLNPCIIGGVKGNITQNEYKGNYYFTRLEEGDEININRPTVVTTALMINRNPNDIYVFYVGQNGGYNDVDDWIKQLRNGIDYIGCDKYLIVVCQTNYHNSTWDETYTKFQKEFGSKFINIHDYLVEYGLQDCGITPTKEDVEAINNGVIPPSLKKAGDTVHFNHYGYTVAGTIIYIRLKALYPAYFNYIE